MKILVKTPFVKASEGKNFIGGKEYEVDLAFGQSVVKGGLAIEIIEEVKTVKETKKTTSKKKKVVKDEA